MTNEEELNPNISPNNESTNPYSESIDTTQNTTASLFPDPFYNKNNNIESEQNNELSNLFQNGTSSVQINDINDLNNNENNINNYSAASSLFNNASENQNEQQQIITNNQQYYNETGNYTNQPQQFYQPQQSFTQQSQETIQQNSLNEQLQQQQAQNNFIQQQQQSHESFIPQQTQESYTQQYQTQESYIQQQQQQQQQNLIQPSPQQQLQQQNLYQQNAYYQQYQQPYYSPSSNQADPYGNALQPPQPQPQVQPPPPQQAQTTPYGIFAPPQQIQQTQPQLQQQQQFGYSHQVNFTNSYAVQQPQQDQPSIQHISSAPVKIGVPPPPKGPSPSYFTPLSPSDPGKRQNQPQPFSPKKVFVPSSTTHQQSQTTTQQRQPAYSASQNQMRQAAPPPPSTAANSPPSSAAAAPLHVQQSPRSPGTKHGPIFVAPYIPGQSNPAKATTSPQGQKDADVAKFRPPPPIAQQPKTQQATIQPPPPNTYIPPNVQQKRDESSTQFQRPPPMQAPSQQQATTATAQAQPPKQSFQPPPQIARPPPPASTKPIYVPGQGRVGAAADGEKAGDNDTAKQPQFAQPPAVPQPQKTASQFAPPPAISQPPQFGQPQKPSPQFAQPPPMPATTAAYVPGQPSQSAASRQPYVPGMKQQPKEDESNTKPSSTPQEIKKPPTFFTPQDASTSGPSFMRPPPMPVALPVGIPVTHSTEEDDQKTQKKRRKRKSKVKSPTDSLSDPKQGDKKTFEPSPVPHFMTPEAVAERGGALPHSQTTGDVSFDEKSDYEYYDYDNEEGFKHSISEPNSVIPISQFTGVYEPFFTKKKPLSALGFGGLVLTRQKEGENEAENDTDNTKKTSNFVNIIKINESKEIGKIETFEPSTTNDEKLEFTSKQISSSKDEEEKLLWAAVRVFISQSSKTFTEEQTSTDSVLREFRENLKKEGTDESELIKILSSSSSSEEDKEESKETEAEQETTKEDSKSEEDKEHLLDEVQKRIIESGEESALEFAIENEMWPIALIISSSLSQEAKQKTVSKYIDAELKSQKGDQFKQLSNALSIISGSQSFTASEWKSQLKEILIHLTPLSQKTSLIKLASVLESNKLNCASIACQIIANLQLASRISFFNSRTSNRQRKSARKLLNEFDSFIVSLLRKSPQSTISINVANVLAPPKMDGNDNGDGGDEQSKKMRTNLALLRAAAQADLGFEDKSREDLKALNCDNDKDGFVFSKRLLSAIDSLSEKVSEESLKVVPLRKEDVPPPPQPKQESEKSSFFVPMAAFIPGLSNQPPIQPQPQQNAAKVQPAQPSFFTPNQAASQTSNQPSFYPTNPSTQRSSAISFYPKESDYDNSNEDREYSANNTSGYTDNSSNNKTGGGSESRQKDASDSQNKASADGEKKSIPAPEGQTQPKRGWFSNLFTKLNPFSSSSKVVDLNEHDNGEMVWNGHRYVMKGHENDDENKGLPPPPPKGVAPLSKAKSSPLPVSEPPKEHSQPQQQQPPPPPIGGPVVGPPPPGGAAPGSGSLTAPPIGAVAPTGRTRVSKRYVANF